MTGFVVVVAGVVGVAVVFEVVVGVVLVVSAVVLAVVVVVTATEVVVESEVVLNGEIISPKKHKLLSPAYSVGSVGRSVESVVSESVVLSVGTGSESVVVSATSVSVVVVGSSWARIGSARAIKVTRDVKVKIFILEDLQGYFQRANMTAKRGEYCRMPYRAELLIFILAMTRPRNGKFKPVLASCAVHSIH